MLVAFPFSGGGKSKPNPVPRSLIELVVGKVTPATLIKVQSRLGPALGCC